jgi:hypothetical protein
MSTESEFAEAADVIAQLILERTQQCDPYPKSPDEMFHVHFSQETQTRFGKKTRTYCFATVLTALLNEERENPRFALVRERIEKTVLSHDPPLREEVAAAMAHLNTLLFHPRVDSADTKLPIAWARAWLEEFDLHGLNYVGASLFAHCWMQYFIAVASVLPKLKWR